MTAAHPPRVFLSHHIKDGFQISPEIPQYAHAYRYRKFPEDIEYVSLPELRERLGKVKEYISGAGWEISKAEALAEIDKLLEGE